MHVELFSTGSDFLHSLHIHIYLQWTLSQKEAVQTSLKLILGFLYG
jgi:hypothetical protein